MIGRVVSDIARALGATSRFIVGANLPWVAGTFGLELVRSVGVDFYQVHWYERFGWNALERPVADLDLGDRAVILGEFAGRTPSAKVLDTAKRAGYRGALVWSILADDDASAYPPDLVAWARADASAGN